MRDIGAIRRFIWSESIDSITICRCLSPGHTYACQNELKVHRSSSPRYKPASSYNCVIPRRGWILVPLVKYCAVYGMRSSSVSRSNGSTYAKLSNHPISFSGITVPASLPVSDPSLSITKVFRWPSQYIWAHVCIRGSAPWILPLLGFTINNRLAAGVSTKLKDSTSTGFATSSYTHLYRARDMLLTIA